MKLLIYDIIFCSSKITFCSFSVLSLLLKTVYSIISVHFYLLIQDCYSSFKLIIPTSGEPQAWYLLIISIFEYGWKTLLLCMLNIFALDSVNTTLTDSWSCKSSAECYSFIHLLFKQAINIGQFRLQVLLLFLRLMVVMSAQFSNLLSAFESGCSCTFQRLVLNLCLVPIAVHFWKPLLSSLYL